MTIFIENQIEEYSGIEQAIAIPNLASFFLRPKARELAAAKGQKMEKNFKNFWGFRAVDFWVRWIFFF